MNLSQLPEDSDSSDEDYVPGGKPEDIPSEVDSDGDSEDPLSDAEDLGKRGAKRKKKSGKSGKKQKTEGVVEPEGAAEEKKKQDDDLWADFMKDTGFQTREQRKQTPAPSAAASSASTSTVPKAEDKKPAPPTPKAQEKVTITQLFEFAGEEVRVEKQVAADSAEARLLSQPQSASKNGKPAARGGGLSGIGSVLSQLGKKAKISTLEKTKLDWDRFKKEENIEEELQTYNKGKDGYLDRQDFLERADLRRFEIEKEVRAVERSKRLNNAPPL